jgi:ribosomal protein L14E/L6E/L27E
MSNKLQPSHNAANVSSKQLHAVQQKVDETKRIMETNVQKALELDEELDDIEFKSSHLIIEAQRFNKKARDLSCKERMKAYRFCLLLAAFVIFVVAILIYMGVK